MKKKQYEKPSLEVVVLNQQTALLAGSGVESTRSGYGDAEDQDWN